MRTSVHDAFPLEPTDPLHLLQWPPAQRIKHTNAPNSRHEAQVANLSTLHT